MVTITEKAVSAVKDYLKQEDKEHYGLRIVAQDGCCSGMKYGFFLTEGGSEDDTVIECEGVNFFVDPNSGTLLAGAKVDYMVGEHGEGFYIENPNEVQSQEGESCGCQGEGGGGGCGCGG